MRLINNRQLRMLSLTPTKSQSHNPFLTMRWFNRTTEVSCGFCRDLSDVAKGRDGAKLEAAIDHSPVLQPWVREIHTSACLSGVVLGKWDEGGKMAPDVRESGGINALFLEHTCRSPLSGRSNASPNPGLKPWAILSDHFMVKNWPRSENITNHWKA
jgi:hypothetical protein